MFLSRLLQVAGAIVVVCRSPARCVDQRDPNLRPTYPQIKTDAWFRVINWKELAVKRVPSPLKVRVAARRTTRTRHRLALCSSQVAVGGDNFDKMTITVDEVVGKSGVLHEARFSALEYAAPKVLENPLSADSSPASHRSSHKPVSLDKPAAAHALVDAGLASSLASVPNSLSSSVADDIEK